MARRTDEDGPPPGVDVLKWHSDPEGQERRRRRGERVNALVFWGVVGAAVLLVVIFGLAVLYSFTVPPGPPARPG